MLTVVCMLFLSLSFVGYKQQKKHPCRVLFIFMVAGVGFEPHDLQVMSLASYRTALPRDR